MITERVLSDLDLPDPGDRLGNPLRGSRLGRCARQSAYMLWPHLFPPLPLPARAKLVFRFGDLIHDMIRREYRRVLPGEWGMEEQRFWFVVPLSTKEADAAQRKIEAGWLLGVVIPDFPRGGSFLKPIGAVLDPVAPALCVPIRVDGIADLSALGKPYYGLATVEIKRMATAGFRAALRGQVDYAYRVQMAAEADAAGLDTHIYVSIRKDTCHILEIIYSRLATAIEVRFTKSSKIVERMRVADNGDDRETDWEAAEVQHPFEPRLLEEARARVRRILVSKPDALPDREYGPSFGCLVCDGSGTQTRQKGRAALLKTPKPCETCRATGTLDEAALPFQCSYCPSVGHCYGAIARLEVTDRPRYLVTRTDYAASGLMFTPPESP